MQPSFALAKQAVRLLLAIALAHRPIRRGKPHPLDRELIISLTSYPARFRTLHRTLYSLLNQTVRPDRIILWIAHDDLACLPAKVTALTKNGIEIRGCPDYRSMKKILPALQYFSHCYIATADDDLYYPSYWLSEMVKAAISSYGVIIAHTVRIPLRKGAQYAPFSQWNLNYHGADAQTPSTHFTFPTGSGALFPPKSLHPDTTDFALFEMLTPTCDDSWLAWMARRAGTKVRRSNGPPQVSLIAWEGTTKGSLFAANIEDVDGTMRQDRVIANLTEYFGPLDELRR